MPGFLGNSQFPSKYIHTEVLCEGEKIMGEPTSSAAAGFGLYKLATVGTIGASLAAIIVMTSSTPATKKEWVVALTSTVASSMFGGAVLANWLKVTSWADGGMIGMAGLIGLCFASGLPAWVLVRAFFKYANKNRDKDLLEIVGEVKGSLKKSKD